MKYSIMFGVVFGVLLTGVQARGQTATLRLKKLGGPVSPGQSFVVEAYIDNLPVPLRGYQVGLDITGGTSGQINVAPIATPVFVDESRSDWVYQGVPDMITAGRAIPPPALLALPLDFNNSVQPVGERYLGTFTLKASIDAAGDFQIGISPPDVADPAAGTILITGMADIFPADVNDPSVIPIFANDVIFNIQGLPVPTTTDWGLTSLALLVLSAGTIMLRRSTLGMPA